MHFTDVPPNKKCPYVLILTGGTLWAGALLKKTSAPMKCPYQPPDPTEKRT
jgi:hypothetical protein